VVLQVPRDPLPHAAAGNDAAVHAAPHAGTVRLQCWLPQLGDRVVHSEEGVVLQEFRQGLPNSATDAVAKAAAVGGSAHPSRAAAAAVGAAPVDLIPSSGIPSSSAAELRLQCWLLELGCWLVCGQEGLLLQAQWQGVPDEHWMLHDIGTVRLLSWIRELA